MGKLRLLYKPQKSAVTLIEILFVLTLVAIFSAIVVPRLRGSLFDKLTVYTSAHAIASDMRLARRLAVNSGTQHRVQFYAVNSSADYNQYAIQIGPSFINLSGVVKAIDDDIVVTDDASVTFSPNGASDSGHTFTYTLGDFEYEIDVKTATGRVKLEAK